MYIDPHIHMVSRTTDDYARMAAAGCVAVTEPAFWAGFDRSSAAGFQDYFRQLTDSEPRRAVLNCPGVRETRAVRDSPSYSPPWPALCLAFSGRRSRGERQRCRATPVLRPLQVHRG